MVGYGKGRQKIPTVDGASGNDNGGYTVDTSENPADHLTNLMVISTPLDNLRSTISHLFVLFTKFQYFTYII